MQKHFASLDDFLKRWEAAERKQAIIEELDAECLPLDLIADELGSGSFDDSPKKRLVR